MKIFQNILLALALATTLSVTAQNYPQKTINGQKFYVHTVKSGDTLYSLAKTYEVSEDLIRQNNANMEAQLAKEAAEKNEESQETEETQKD